jgi:hypothetical protein
MTSKAAPTCWFALNLRITVSENTTTDPVGVGVSVIAAESERPSAALTVTLNA